MKKIQVIFFAISGFIALFSQLFSIYIILILLGIITNSWLVLTIIGILYTILDIWKHFVFTKQGLKAKLGRYA